MTAALKRGPRGQVFHDSGRPPSCANDAELARLDDLRRLLRVNGTEVFDPQPAIAEALQLARLVRGKSGRFSQAVVDLAVTREINAITHAAELACRNLGAMAALVEVL